MTWFSRPAVGLSGSRSLLICPCVCCSGGPLILQIPALPVMTGSDVTLQCRHKTRGPVPAFFYMDGGVLQNEYKSGFIIHNVQQTHEGLYWCSTDSFGPSPQSSLRVRGEDDDITSCLQTWLVSKLITEDASIISPAGLAPASPPKTPPSRFPAASPTPPPPVSVHVPVIGAVGSLVLVLVLDAIFLFWCRHGGMDPDSSVGSGG